MIRLSSTCYSFFESRLLTAVRVKKLSCVFNSQPSSSNFTNSAAALVKNAKSKQLARFTGVNFKRDVVSCVSDEALQRVTGCAGASVMVDRITGVRWIIEKLHQAGLLTKHRFGRWFGGNPKQHQGQGWEQNARDDENGDIESWVPVHAKNITDRSMLPLNCGSVGHLHAYLADSLFGQGLNLPLRVINAWFDLSINEPFVASGVSCQVNVRRRGTWACVGNPKVNVQLLDVVGPWAEL